MGGGRMNVNPPAGFPRWLSVHALLPADCTAMNARFYAVISWSAPLSISIWSSSWPWLRTCHHGKRPTSRRKKIAMSS